MKKVLFVATVVKTHIMEFHIPALRLFKQKGWETAVAARNDYADSAECSIPFCDAYYDVPFEREPMRRGNIRAFRELKRIISEGEYDIIHCHTPVGAMLARLAAIKVRKTGTRVIYTAHGFHFYKGAPLKNWVLYYPVEWLLAHITDVLITINREDYARAKKTLKAKETVYMPGVGIDTARFQADSSNRHELRRSLGVAESDFVILSVGELSHRKNHTVVLEALAKLKDTEEFKHIQYLICGQGQLENELKYQCKTAGIEEHVHFLGYRNDISSICNCSDLFVFMSLQEGLPVALMEAMGCGMIVLCSPIRGNVDLVQNGVSGYFVENNAEDVAKATIMLINEDKAESAQRIRDCAMKSVQRFSVENTMQHLQKIYRI